MMCAYLHSSQTNDFAVEQVERWNSELEQYFRCSTGWNSGGTSWNKKVVLFHGVPPCSTARAAQHIDFMRCSTVPPVPPQKQ